MVPQEQRQCTQALSPVLSWSERHTKEEEWGIVDQIKGAEEGHSSGPGEKVRGLLSRGPKPYLWTLAGSSSVVPACLLCISIRWRPES